MITIILLQVVVRNIFLGLKMKELLSRSILMEMYIWQIKIKRFVSGTYSFTKSIPKTIFPIIDTADIQNEFVSRKEKATSRICWSREEKKDFLISGGKDPETSKGFVGKESKCCGYFFYKTHFYYISKHQINYSPYLLTLYIDMEKMVKMNLALIASSFQVLPNRLLPHLM